MLYEKYFDDPNFSHPAYFITCFDVAVIDKYRQAIVEYAAINPQHNLDIDTSGRWNELRDPALLCFDRSELSEFYKILERLKA